MGILWLCLKILSNMLFSFKSIKMKDIIVDPLIRNF